MEVLTAKIIAMLVLGAGSLISGVLPNFISERRRRNHPLLVSCLLCFGAGVLLSTSLVHMLPEARHDLPRNSELFLCLGFLLIYFIDEIVHCLNKRRQEPISPRDYGSTSDKERDPLMRNARLEDGSAAYCHVSHSEPCVESLSGVVSLLCALFVHSVLEGLAIGLQNTVSQVMLLFGAVASHKYVVGFCLGAELCAGPASLRTRLAMIVLFSAGSVLGIALGAGMEAVSSVKNSSAVPIMQAVAAGTLLYVTVSEVLPRERARWHRHRRGQTAGLKQLASVLTGFLIMYLTTVYLDHHSGV